MIFKNLTFDGISLKEYGVYISGEAVFDSPTREVEMITIPGRNGSFALDKGRFNNITVTYPAGIYATNETEFAEKVSTLRNLLASRKGYCRLTDEYNPDEFRLGVYKAGLELDPTHYNEAGRFELSFDCKPQRFLFSGEEVFTLGEWGQTETHSGSIVSFEGDETTAIKSLTAQIVPKQSGSGDPSPSNVRPISGYSEVKTTRCGKNLFDKSTMVKMWYMDSNNKLLYDGTTILFSVPIGTEFVLSGTNGNRNRLCYIDKPLSEVALNDVTTFISNASLPIHLTSQHQTYAYYMNSTQNASLGDSLQLELGSTATTYEPYQGTSYPISLGQTVYGGTLDVVSGKLTLTRAIKTITQNDSISKESTARFLVQVNDMKREATSYIGHIICDKLPTIERYTLLAPDTVAVTGFAGNGYVGQNWIYFSNGTSTTVADMKTWLASNPLQVSYELATPTEVTLTPTEVNTLLGQNNIWADSGDVTVEIGQNPYILVNPTLFEACPLIEFNSSGEDGEINLGSRQIKVLSAILGRINLGLDVSGSKTTTRTWQDVITVQNAGSFNAGDTLRFNGGKVIFTFNFTPINVEVVSQGTDLKASWQRGSNNLELSLNNLEFPAGTDTTYSFTCDIKVKASETPSIEGTETFTVTTSYSRNGVLTITWAGGNYSFGEYTYIQGASNYTGYGDSTKNSLEDVDIYVDLDIGEAYSVDSSDNVVSLNNFVNLGGELPTLDPGATEISTDDSISNVKVTPRWWKV